MAHNMPEHIEVYIFGCLLETLARLKDPMVLKSFKNHRRYLVGPFTRDLAWEHCDAIGRRFVDAYAYAKWLVLVFEGGVSLCFSMGLASYVTSASEDELANSIPFRDEANLVFTLTFAGYERNVVFVGCNESTAGQVTNVRRFFRALTGDNLILILSGWCRGVSHRHVCQRDFPIPWRRSFNTEGAL